MDEKWETFHKGDTIRALEGCSARRFGIKDKITMSEGTIARVRFVSEDSFVVDIDGLSYVTDPEEWEKL